MSGGGPSRPRHTNTCRMCKRRKLRCDQARPSCTRCLNTPGTVCTYDSDLQREFQFVSMESLVNVRPRPKGSTMIAPEIVAVHAEKLKALEQRLESLTGIIQSLQSSRTSDFEPSEESGDHSQSAKRPRQSSPP